MPELDSDLLDLAATAIFAYSGAAIAHERSYVFPMICLFGVLTAVGGGTLRQWILQNDSRLITTSG